jgi:hypothetical protein
MPRQRQPLLQRFTYPPPPARTIAGAATLATTSDGLVRRGRQGRRGSGGALDGCAAGADGPDGDVLRAMRGLLEQIEDRTDRDPLRQERTPGFDLAVVAATVARTPDAPLPGH